jgi:ribosomal protein S18 acetylase RimI-like enzyme
MQVTLAASPERDTARMATVRLARDEDGPALAALIAAFRDWWSREQPSDPQIERGVDRLLSDPDTELLVASAAPGGEPVAMAQLRYRFVVWVDGEECELEDLFVAERARRSGIGKALVEASVERARARGCRRMQLNTNEANAAALALYERCGFSAWFDPPGGRNLNMRLALE